MKDDGEFGSLEETQLRWTDRVYGAVIVDDPRIVRLIATPTFQRLKGVRQAGPSALAFAFKNVTRYEHSIGVYLLLRRLGASLREQVAGLLHDISHTAFSHAVDFIFASEEQDYHERIKPKYLQRPDIVAGLRVLGFVPEDFYDDAVYPLLERPLPLLCADRLDYFLRDSLTCDVLTPAEVELLLGSVTVADKTIRFTDSQISRLAADRFAEMNRNWWASPTEAYIYNEFANALRIGIDAKVLSEDDLLEDDEWVLERLRRMRHPTVTDILDRIARFESEPADLSGYVPAIEPKQRWLDPLVLSNDVR